MHADLLEAARRHDVLVRASDRRHADVGLRTGSSIEYRLIDRDEDRVIGTVDDARVFAVAHPGAVYLHQGRQYRVERARPARSRRGARAVRRRRRVHPAAHRDRHRDRRRGPQRAARRGDRAPRRGRGPQPGRRVPAQADLDQRRDRGRAISTSRSARSSRARAGTRCRSMSSRRPGSTTAQLLGTVHAAEHGLIGMLPLFTICDRWDVGGVSMALHPQTGEPTIFVYDGYPGGAGIAELAFEAAARHARGDARPRRRVPVRRRLPVVRAVTEVRQLERVPRQGRRDRAAPAHGTRARLKSTSARARARARPGSRSRPRPRRLNTGTTRAGHRSRARWRRRCAAPRIAPWPSAS